jgi:hypothetical protein
MYTYRIVLDAYNSRSAAPSARVVTYSRGFNRENALSKIRAIYIAQDGSVSDGINVWPGSNNLPAGNVKARYLPEWEIVSMRAVIKAGHARIVSE